MNEMMPYILEQSGLLTAMLADRAKLSEPFVKAMDTVQPDQLVLVASGTSRNAACAAAPFMEKVLKTPVRVEAPSCLEDVYGRAPLLLFISQGGNSTNTIAAIESHKQLPSLALTGTPNGEINKICDHAVLLPCGEEKAGPKSKGYTTTIMMLYLMTLESALHTGAMEQQAYDDCIAALQTAAAQMPENIERIKAWETANSQTLRNMQVAYFVGKKQDALVGAEGALKLMETILIPSFSFDFEEFLHGSSCSIDSKVAGFYLLPPASDKDFARMRSLLAVHREQAAPVFAISGEPAADVRDLCLLTGPWYTQPFALILPFQILANDLPAPMGLEGVGHERFWNLDKKLSIKAKFEG